MLFEMDLNDAGLFGSQKITTVIGAVDMKNERLKRARILAALTQLQLGERVGCREMAISRYETGRAKPTAETKRRIAETLKQPIYELFDS